MSKRSHEKARKAVELTCGGREGLHGCAYKLEKVVSTMQSRFNS